MRIAVFKTGTHTDAAGHVRDWSQADLDAIAAKYNPAQHEAPVVIGHPKENGPAYGWVEKLQREGDTLWAQIKPTVNEFTGWLRQGLFKKRSISLYPDLTLRHIGFLGATPPAVKGLPDPVSFKEGEATLFEFADISEKERKELADKGEAMSDGSFPIRNRTDLENAIHDWGRAGAREDVKKHIVKRARALGATDMLPADWEGSTKKETKGGRMNFWEGLKEKLAAAGMSFKELFGSDTPPVLYTEEDVRRERQRAEDAAKEKAAAEFAEKEMGYKAREEALAAKEAEARKGQVKEFVEGLKKKGIIIPAMEKLGMGITSFMQAVSEVGSTYEFAEPGEDGKRKKETPLEFMQAFLASLPAQIEFREVAEKDEVLDEASPDDKKRDKAIEDHMKAHKVPYKDAVFAVAKKHPEWFGHKRKGEK